MARASFRSLGRHSFFLSRVFLSALLFEVEPVAPEHVEQDHEGEEAANGANDAADEQEIQSRFTFWPFVVHQSADVVVQAAEPVEQ